jgi:hypothetical protein|tara:strand:- start:437 stop:793 length:357 start_codon:yes stop_codon:yes gene_type:complete
MQKEVVMGVVLAPILEGKLEAWKAWCEDLQGPQKEAVADFNRRYGLTRHSSWLTETPAGPVAIAIHEDPGAEELMPKLAGSQNEFDIAFKQALLDIHGMDVTQPPPGPMPELYFDSSG